MKLKYIYIAMLSLFVQPMTVSGQESVSSGVTKQTAEKRAESGNKTLPSISQRLATKAQSQETDDSDAAWMKVVYRHLDMKKAPNAALYYPEEATEGEYNLFRLMMNLLISDNVTAYEYLDGREVFTESNKVKTRDMLDRFDIPYSEGKGYSEKHQVFNVDENDMPSSEVLSYYIIEKWDFDRRDSRMRRHVEAICPVLHRSEEFGYEAVRYPLFWMKYNDLKPYLTERLIFTDDDNNVPSSTYDDYFTLGLYDGEIYKTRNLRNKSMAELYPDPDERKRAQDSIEHRLNTFEARLWVTDPVELSSENDSINENTTPKRRVTSSRGTTRKAEKKVKTRGSTRRSSQTATRSVRNRKS